MAAIVALAACTKTEVIRTKGQSEIAFKAYSGVVTKAPVEAGPFSETMNMGVNAWFAQTGEETPATVQKYFVATEFLKDGTYWACSNPKYYPTTGFLDFTAYSPYGTNVAQTTVTDELNYLYTMTDNKSSQTDFLVSEFLRNAKEGTAHTLNFKHALSMVEIKIKANIVNWITVNKVTITNVNQAGTAKVLYSNREKVFPTIIWTATGTAEDFVLKKDQAITAEYAVYQDATLKHNILVVPTSTADKSIKINYTMKKEGETEAITVEHSIGLGDAGKWEPSKKYIYQLNMTFDEIELNPVVVDWDATISEEIEY